MATDGVLYLQSQVSTADIGDGISHTLAVGERIDLRHDRAVDAGRRVVQDRRVADADKRVRGGDQARRVADQRAGEPPRAITCEIPMLRRSCARCGKTNWRSAANTRAAPTSRSPTAASIFSTRRLDLAVYRELATRQGEETSQWAP